MSRACFVFLFAIFTATHANKPGGWSVLDVSSQRVVDATRAAVKLMNEKSKSQHSIVLVKIERAFSQVVAGINYRVILEAGESDCFKDARSLSHQSATNCPPRAGMVNQYEVVVWWRPWAEPPFQLTKVTNLGADSAMDSSLVVNGKIHASPEGQQASTSFHRPATVTTGAKAFSCNCPPSMVLWQCTQIEFEAIQSGVSCPFFRHSFRAQNDGSAHAKLSQPAATVKSSATNANSSTAPSFHQTSTLLFLTLFSWLIHWP